MTDSTSGTRLENDAEPAGPIGTVTLFGDCEPVIATAVLFGMMDWRVAIVSGTERHAALRERLAGFADGSGIAVESDPLAGWEPDVVVYCGTEGGAPHLPEGWRGVTAIELNGVRYDDGATGCRRSCADLIAYMRSGLAMVTRRRDAETEPTSPFLPAGLLPSYFLALHAVMLAGAVLEANERPGRIVISGQEALLATLHNAAGFAQIEGRDVGREPEARRVGGRMDCKDGSVLISMSEAHQWQKLLILLGRNEWEQEQWWREPAGLAAHREQLTEAIAAWCADRTRLEAFTTLQDMGMPAAYLASAEDVFSSPQLLARGFFGGEQTAQRVFNRPYRVATADADRGEQTRPAVQTGRITAAAPLAGLTVCDLSWAWAGPYLTMYLAMLGATVVKVESRARIDVHRLQPPFAPGTDVLHDRAMGHLLTNRGKLGITADFKHPGGLQLVKDLIAKSDLLVANFAPGVLERLGLGFDVAAALAGRRGFVYGELSGFGETGPWRGYRSYGTHLADLSGLSSLTGTPEAAPVSIGIPFSDPLGGVFGAAAMLSCLRRSRQLQTPLYLDLSQLEVLALGIADALWLGRPSGNRRRGDLAGTGVYACSGPDNWIAVSVRRPEALAALAAVVGATETDLDGHLEAAVVAWAGRRDCHEAATELRTRGIDCTEVLSVADLLRDEGLLNAGFWVRTPLETGELLGQNAPWIAGGRRPEAVSPAPRLGEHNERVLREVLGYTEDRLRALQESGALE